MKMLSHARWSESLRTVGENGFVFPFAASRRQVDFASPDSSHQIALDNHHAEVFFRLKAAVTSL